MRMKRGCLIAIDGGEGCGKSTQSELLVRSFKASGFDVLHTRQPGGTPLGSELRELLLHSDTVLTPAQQALVFAADRAIHIAQVIKPALMEKKIVVCDRWSSSTFSYQGQSWCSDEFLHKLKLAATDRIDPDLLIILDIDPTDGFARKKSDNLDNFETKDIEWHQDVRKRFLEYVTSEKMYHTGLHDVIDADRSVAQVHRDVVHSVNDCLDFNLSVLEV